MSRYTQEETLSPFAITEKTDKPVHVCIHSLADHCLPLLYEQFVAIDLETTGLSREHDRIIEIGAVVFRRGEIVDTFSTLVDPGRYIPWQSTQITGITNRMVEDAPDEERALGLFYEFLMKHSSLPLFYVAHNAGFDLGFLEQAFLRQHMRWHGHAFDTLCASRSALSHPPLPSYSLASLARRFSLVNKHAHRAAADAEVCGLLLCKLFAYILPQNTTTDTTESDDTLPSPGEQAFFAAVRERLVREGIDVQKLTFWKTPKSTSAILYQGIPILRFKVLKTKAYLLLPQPVANKYGLSFTNATKKEGKDEEIVRVAFDPFKPDLPFLAELVASCQKADSLCQALVLKQ